MPARLLAADVRRQVIDGERVRTTLSQPTCPTFFQPDIAAGNDTFSDRHPCFQAKTRGLQRDIILHPFTQPRLDVNIVGLQPDPTVIQQPVVITQIHSHLHNTVLPSQTGETDLAFSAMSVFTVKPGKLWDRQFCTLA